MPEPRGDDRIDGGPGFDLVYAGAGLFGGTGHDRLVACSGADSLQGGTGDDENYGNRGSDRCRSPRSGADAHSCER